MNLTTHWIFAIALGIAIFHNIEIALIISLGALIPDLDREYLFVAKNFIGRHQLHRALFHNLFLIGALYFVNPFLSLGALSHSSLDTLTSATDRGAEVFFPVTRILKKFYFSIRGTPLTTTKQASWWVEDPWALLKASSDRDLQEPTQQAWRRSYGPFKNSRVADWGIFFGSLVFLLMIYFGNKGSMFSLSNFHFGIFISLAGIAVFYLLGEIWRRRIIDNERQLNQYFVLTVLILGLIFFVGGGYFFVFAFPGFPNLTLPGYALVSALVGIILGYLFVRFRKEYADLSM
jgi:hypothetical protein